ncbi:MAG: hypothetical protein ABI632_13000 [Pseudolysinimonas sp.]
MRKLPVATLALAVLLLSGCVPESHRATPTPTPSATPVFASEDEALAAAEDAYAAYESAVDASLSTYDTTSLSQVATGTALQAAKDSVDSFKKQGRKLTGHSQIDSVRFAQSAGLTGPDPTAEIEIYGCLDIGATDVVDSSGASVVPSSRVDRISMLISLELDRSNGLLVSSADVWDGDDFCN